MWNGINYPLPNFNGATVEVWEWMTNFIPHFIMDVINYPCWDQSEVMLVKRAFANVVNILLYIYIYIHGSIQYLHQDCYNYRLILISYIQKKNHWSTELSLFMWLSRRCVYQSSFVALCHALWHQGVNLSKNPAAASVCSDTGVWMVSH